MTTAIEVRGVSKRFRLAQEAYSSLKERVLHFGRVPSEEFWALRDVTLSVETGQTLGLLGHNGSGKSTLLKCMGGILQPTSGEIRTVGRLAALLELGAGFHPELTGRENIFLNGSILGLSRRTIARRFDEIVAFAELEDFIDMQVRNFSSGMYVRLGFAVAVNVDPEILLVDEVLAVGDEAFQRKCLDRVAQLQREGRTIVVVTHSPELVRQVCDVAGVLDHGRLVYSGEPGRAVRTFREHLLRQEAFEAEVAPVDLGGGTPPVPQPTSPLRITDVGVTHAHGDERSAVASGGSMTVRVGYAARSRLEDVSVVFAVYDLEGGLLFRTSTATLGQPVGPVHGTGEIDLTVERVPLLDGTYRFTLGLTSPDGGTVYDWHEQAHGFEVWHPSPVEGIVDLPLRAEVRAGAEGSRA